MVPRSTKDFQGHPGGFPAPMGSLRARTCAPGLASSAAWPWPGQALAKPLFFSLSSSMQFSSSSTYGIDRAGRHACKGMSPQCPSPSICGTDICGRHVCKGLNHQCLSPSICGTEMFGRHVCKGLSHQCLAPSICGTDIFGRNVCKGLSHQCPSPSTGGIECAWRHVCKCPLPDLATSVLNLMGASRFCRGSWGLGPSISVSVQA